MCEEIFDVVDLEGNPTGTTVPRGYAHRVGILHRTVHIWITREQAGRLQVLLQKRCPIKDSFPNMYDTSSAGHIQAGDEVLETAQRELQEELGISSQLDDFKFVGKFHGEYELNFHGAPFHDNEIAFVYLYKRPVNINDLVLQKEEVSEVKWFNIAEVYKGCVHRDGTFCVPLQGLQLIMQHFHVGQYTDT